jgi:hypothetical protein
MREPTTFGLLTVLLGFTSVLAGGGVLSACSSPSTTPTNSSGASGTSGSSQTSSPSDSTVVSAADCTSRCTTRSTACKIPAAQSGQVCASLCDGSLSTKALECIEVLDCSAGQDMISACQRDNPVASGTSGTSGGAAAGDACTCHAGASYCAGTDVCGGGSLKCLVRSSPSGVCSQSCKGASDTSCPTGTSCTDAGKDPITTGDRGFWCL